MRSKEKLMAETLGKNGMKDLEKENSLEATSNH